MAGKKRSGLANDRRAYGCSSYCPIRQRTPTYTVTYNGNNNTGGTVPTDGSSPYAPGSTVIVLGNSSFLVRTGFTFAGWNTAADGLGTSYLPGITFTITANTTLYAQWTPTYTVTYNGNDPNTSGTVPIDTSSPYAPGSTVTVLGNSGPLVLTGYVFTRWNTAANGSGTSYLPTITFIINANTTLYAVWTQAYTVTYEGNENTGGSVPTDSSPYASGSTVTVLGNSGSLVKTGLTFTGWNTAADGLGTSYSPGSTFIITADTILYAKWTLVPPPAAPTALSSVGGNTEAYILFTQIGTITNYEYSTDGGTTFRAFDPPQNFSPVNISTLSSDGTTSLVNGTTYIVILRAVNSGVSSLDSASVDVVPTTTSLLATNRLIYLDANNSSSYPGSGTTWTNLDSGGTYSAALNGSPTFDDTTEPGNKYFEFNPGSSTGQYAQINQATAINPLANTPFTIQMWVRINNVGSQGTLVSKVFESSSYDGYALGYSTDSTLRMLMNGSQVNFYTSITGVLSSGWALYTANIQFGNAGGRQNKLFVNGRQVFTQTNTDTGISSFTNIQNFTFPTGHYGDGKCDIGQFYYYNTELTTTQIIQNFDATKHTYYI